MNLLNAIRTGLLNAGRARTRDVLLRQSDRTLADAGFSRELLLAGVRAWPWRAEGASDDARDAAELRERQRRAVRELRAMDDRELDDLAIARADIPRVVREGRAGIEVVRPAQDDRIAA